MPYEAVWTDTLNPITNSSPVFKFTEPKLKQLDVYVCSLLNTNQRREMARLSIERWRDIAGINLTLLIPSDSHQDVCFPEWRDLQIARVGFSHNFQKERRTYTDKTSKQCNVKYYVVADDDCLVDKEIDLVDCIRILDDHPSYAILSTMPDNEKINEWTPDLRDTGYSTANDSAVMEHVSVGGIRFCRTGYPKAWPPLKGKAYDGPHAEAIRRDNMRVGFFRYINHHHLGKGLSTVYEPPTETREGSNSEGGVQGLSSVSSPLKLEAANGAD